MKTRTCPKCNKIISYKKDKDCRNAENIKSTCKSCSRKKEYTTKDLTKQCPICNIDMVYNSYPVFSFSVKKNCSCKQCQYKKFKENPSDTHISSFFKKGQRPINADFRKNKNIYEIYGKDKAEKLLESMSKRKQTLESNIKRSESCKRANCGAKNIGKRCSDENKIKFRKYMVERLNKTHKNFHPPYNDKACEYFDKLIIETGNYIQHALNGGEYHIKELGYWVDGYDEKNNIVYEYDEKWHFNVRGELRQKDINRQRDIEKLLGCTFIRIKEE